MYPDTRGRISTDSTASRRPVNSSHSFTSFSTTVTTLTGNGAAWLLEAVFLQSTTDRETAANAAIVTSRFTLSESSRPRERYHLSDTHRVTTLLLLGEVLKNASNSSFMLGPFSFPTVEVWHGKIVSAFLPMPSILETFAL